MQISTGVLLAILEKAEVIKGNPNLNTGTVSAGYQNFIICVEMFFASVALRYAFPYQIYGDFTVTGTGRTVTMQSISSSLKVRVQILFLMRCTPILVVILCLLILLILSWWLPLFLKIPLSLMLRHMRCTLTQMLHLLAHWGLPVYPFP